MAVFPSYCRDSAGILTAYAINSTEVEVQAGLVRAEWY